MNFFATNMLARVSRVLGAALLAALLIPAIAFSQSPIKPDLKSAGNFVVIANTTITSTGGGTITGNIALNGGSSITGFPPGIVTGEIHVNDITAQNAQSDFYGAYIDCQARASTATLTGNLGGQTLAPGVYKQTSSELISSGDLTLDAQGDANGVWIFQIATTLTTGTNIILKGGAQAKNIFWQVGTSATLGSGSVFYGNILAHTSITMNSTVTMVGRSMAYTGAVTANGSGAENPDSLKQNTPIFLPIFETASHIVEVNSKHIDSSGWTLIKISNPGTATLTINVTGSTNTHFASHMTALTVPAGGQIIDSIKFLPTAAGDDSARLYFTHNAATSPDTINVHGILTATSAIFSTASRNISLGSTHIDTAKWTLVTITNTGTDTLHFTTSTSTNVDFTSHLPAMKIAPGASITDSIKFLPTVTGPDSGKLVFAGNGTTSPDTILVNGVGRAAVLVRIKQGLTNQIGDVHVGRPSWRLDTLMNTGNDSVFITSDTSLHPAFSSHLSAMVIAPGARIIDSIRYLPTKMGADTGKLVLRSNALFSPDTIPVTSSGLSGIFTTPFRTVNSGTTLINVPTTVFITISNTGNDVIHLSAPTSTNGFFTSHLSGVTIQAGGYVVDTITFLPTSVGLATGKLIFASDATTPIDTVAVYGTGISATVKTAILGTSARYVNCGSIKVGGTTTSVITIFNTGTDTLRITSTTSTNPLVFVSQLSGTTVAPGAYVIDTIKFTPSAVGQLTGNLIFVSNAINSPDTIGAYGIGTPLVGVNEGNVPAAFALGEVYPNPFSDETNLRVTLQNGEQLLDAGMYDMLGREVQDWTSRIAGFGSLALHLGTFPKGEYIIRLRTTERMQVLPVMIVR